MKTRRMLIGKCRFAECQIAECPFAECRFAENRFVLCRFTESCFGECRLAEFWFAECRICRINNRKWASFLIFYLTMNEQWYSVYILYDYNYSLFRRIGSIPYLFKMQNKKKKTCVQYSLIYNIDVTLGRRLRKLYISERTSAVFTSSSF